MKANWLTETGATAQTDRPVVVVVVVVAAAAILVAGEAMERLEASCSGAELLSLSIVNLNSASSQSCTHRHTDT